MDTPDPSSQYIRSSSGMISTSDASLSDPLLEVVGVQAGYVSGLDILQGINFRIWAGGIGCGYWSQWGRQINLGQNNFWVTDASYGRDSV